MSLSRKAFGALFVVAAAAAQADQAVEFSGSLISPPDHDLILGWQFTANQNINVTSLSYFDLCGGALLSDHIVGIFDAEGNLLMQGQVNAGQSTPLDHSFVTTSAITTYGETGTTLLAGNSYIIAGSSPGFLDPWAYGAVSTFTGYTLTQPITVTTNGALFTYTSNFTTGGMLNEPQYHYSNYDHYFGPNFSGQAVPEPTTCVSVAAGVLGLIRRRRNA